MSVVLLGFQAWLGAVVVYSVLAPIKITIHMVMALVIVALLLYLLQISQKEMPKFRTTPQFKMLLLLAVLLTMIQVIFGTQVRQFVDKQVGIVGYDAPSKWLDNPNLYFYLHRSFSIVVVLLNVIIWYFNRKRSYGFTKLNWVLILLLIEAFTGIAMYYFDFPFLSQPLHLVIASVLFGIQFYIVLEAFNTSKQVETSQILSSEKG